MCSGDIFAEILQISPMCQRSPTGIQMREHLFDSKDRTVVCRTILKIINNRCILRVSFVSPAYFYNMRELLLQVLKKMFGRFSQILLQKKSLLIFNKKVYFTEGSHLIIIDVQFTRFPDEGSDI